MRFRPLHDLVIVEISKPGEKSAGGIFLPEKSRDKNSGTKEGVVVAVGPGKTTDKGEKITMNLKVGETVLVGWGGNDVECDDKTYRFLRENDVLAVIS